MILGRFLGAAAALACTTCATAAILPRQAATSPDQCPGYSALNVVENGNTITADLSLAGPACSVYGYDLTNLKLFVQYEVCSNHSTSISFFSKISGLIRD